MINPGSEPVENATEEHAAANMVEFVAEFQERGGHLAGDPIRTTDLDEGGRFGWLLPLVGGGASEILMPGVELTRLRDDLTAQAPCVRVNGLMWWWRDAVGSAVPLEPGRWTG